MTRFIVSFLGLFSLIAVYILCQASFDIASKLSPQGCRMSWMYPSYTLQSDFNASWTPLATRYSLWLYREAGLQPNHVSGVPVLFIPGNAGSSEQVRSIASSAAKQFFESPGAVTHASNGRKLRPLDVFAVEFNEDLSAFHGPTLESEVAYSSKAISYVLSLYPPNTSIVIIGHSMGGIVAVSLLPSPHISTIVTMSTPHVLPPARFDARMDKLYAANARKILSDPTPILSICGGATDTTVPSESCNLPEIGASANLYRRTVFTTALEGAWTSVGHKAIVWCHQVRWRVARAALELGSATSDLERAGILDEWLRDGHLLPLMSSGAAEHVLSDESMYTFVSEGMRLLLEHPQGNQTYLLRVPNSAVYKRSRFVLFVSQGSVESIAPHHRGSLDVSVHRCQSGYLQSSIRCSRLKPVVLQLLPNPPINRVFPMPDEGVDESEGVVLYEAEVSAEDTWIGVQVNAHGRGWVVGGFDDDDDVIDHASGIAPFLGKVSVRFPSADVLRRHIHLPNLISNALIVYRVVPTFTSSEVCSEPLMPPLLSHTSQTAESHFFPMMSSVGSRRILLHMHNSGPHLNRLNRVSARGINLTVYSSGSAGCSPHLEAIDVHVDWWSTLGRWAGRYFTAAGTWAISVIALLFFEANRAGDKGAPIPSVQQSLHMFVVQMLPKLLLASFVISFVPFPDDYYLGNGGEVLFTPLAPILLLLSTGLVCASWWVLCVLMWPIGKLGSALFGRQRIHSSVPRQTLLSMGVIFLLIFLLLPWQVAFLVCWIIHFYTCATSMIHAKVDREKRGFQKESQHFAIDNLHHKMHVLLLMTWLLPLVGPVLAVWVRTLMTAGFTTPFDGDHNFVNVAPYLTLVDFASWVKGPLFERSRFERRVTVSWSFVVIAITGFMVGSRATYRVFEATTVATACLVILRIGPRYWGKGPW